MKRVLIDACCLGRRKTGNETYIRGLLSGLARLQDEWSAEFEISVIVTDQFSDARSGAFRWFEIPVGNFAVRNFVTIPSLLSRKRADLYHGSYWLRFWSQPCPSVLMVHDLSFVAFPQGFHRHEQLVYANLVKWCARAARGIVTVSEFSKTELTKWWEIPPERITVTPNGIDDAFQPAEKAGAGPLLYVGNLHPRKNLVTLLEAFVRLRSVHRIAVTLKIVGQPTWMSEGVFDTVRRNGLDSSVEFTGYISQQELVRSYQDATFLIYPSLYEGFGLPPVEAMACGCPVITSDGTSLPEVTGDAAKLVDPTDPIALADAMAALLSSPEARAKMRAAGLAQVQRFTWERCARTTLDAWRRAA